MHSDYQHQTKCFISQTSGPCPGFNIDSSFRHNLGEIRGNGVAGKVAKRTFRLGGSMLAIAGGKTAAKRRF